MLKSPVKREVLPEDLLITKQLSMDPYDYAHNVLQTIAAVQHFSSEKPSFSMNSHEKA
jgi:hypothetical protein